MTELAQSLRLNLADSLPRYIEFLPDLLKRSRSSVFKTEAQLENVFLSRRQRVKHLAELLAEQRIRCGVCRSRRILILYKIAYVAVLFLADGCFKGNGILRNLDYLADFSGLTFRSFAISSGVASLPSSWLISLERFVYLCIVSTICTGILIVRA